MINIFKELKDYVEGFKTSPYYVIRQENLLTQFVTLCTFDHNEADVEAVVHEGLTWF
jgi:hypothetical protein